MAETYCLTPTGGRSEGLSMLGEYLDAQTYDCPLTWVIVDDCDPATRVPKVRDGITIERVRPHWRWQHGQNTQAKCMAAGLERVPEDACLVILEDDDGYLPEHIQTVLEALQGAELVGEKGSRYYNVATGRYRLMTGEFHASMASVAVRGGALKLLRQICAGTPPLDMKLWRQFTGAKKFLETSNVVGIKGMPGRGGIGVGHRLSFGKPDPGHVLNEWLDGYADNYSIFRRDA